MAYIPSGSELLNPEKILARTNIREGMRVADFGCGAGHITILVAQKVGEDGKVTALDIMEDKLDSVRARGKAAGLENIDTVRTNLEVGGSSGLADGSQDIVILATILFQSQKKADILKEAARVLKSAGFANARKFDAGQFHYGFIFTR